MTGTLYVVATPIGNLNDISPRALATLQAVSAIAAEDTRHTRSLLQHFAITKPLISLHQHNEVQRTTELLARLTQGETIALVSDAGTPLVSDPGQSLIAAAQQAGVTIVPIPGPCALVAALSAAGFPADQFVFAGFVPAKASARNSYLETLAHESRTIVFYEAPHRIIASITAMLDIFGTQREAVIARELTKTFETIKRASLADLLMFLQNDSHQQRGEFVIVVAGAAQTTQVTQSFSAQQVLEILLAELPVKQASKLAAEITGESRNVLYDLALSLKKTTM